MSQWCRVSVRVLALCFTFTASSTHGLGHKDPPSGESFPVAEERTIEDNIRKDMEQKFTAFSDTIDNKLENTIRKLQEYIDSKFDSIDAKISQKLDETFNGNKKIATDVKEQIKKVNVLDRKIDGVRKTTVDNNQKLRLMNTVPLNNAELSKIYNKIDETYDVTVENSQALKELLTYYNASKTVAQNNTLCLALTNSSITADEFKPMQWSECEEEEVKNKGGFYDYRKPLRSLAKANLRYVSQSEGCSTYLNMRVGVRADNYVAFLLSPESEPMNQGFLFKIEIQPHKIGLYTVEKGEMTILKIVYRDIYLSYTHPALFYIQISNDTLMLRQGFNDSELLLTSEDQRFAAVKYFGFDSYLNSNGHAIFLYEC